MHILDQIRLEFNLITVPWYDLILYPKKERRKRSCLRTVVEMFFGQMMKNNGIASFIRSFAAIVDNLLAIKHCCWCEFQFRDFNI